ncbi:MAG TPA: hypothetical protein VK534_00540 [Methylomirabilota bacterium]|nr:hypothetical protein [Methylomirabilota bacterium]
MTKHNQDGAANGLVISLVLATLLLIGMIGFAAWAYTSRADYKDKSDQKVAAAVEVAKQQESKLKDLQFAEEIKNPLKIYVSPEASGSLSISFPKTWSGYVEDGSSSNSALLDGFFSPGVVPSTKNTTSVFALRVKVVGQPYATVLKGFDSLQKSGKLTSSAYSLPKVPKVIGVKVNGEISDKKTVTMVVLPLRSQALEIWTEGTTYLDDFNNIILPNFSFSP